MYEAAALPEYAADRRQRLEQLAWQRPHDVVSATVILARPLAPAGVHSLIDEVEFNPLYFEWLQVGTDLRGGNGWTKAGDRAAEFPGLRVIFLNGSAEAASLRSLAADERVWLVDVEGAQNLFDLAVDAGLVRKP